MNKQMGLLAKKIGMTEFYLEDGTRVPVTVLLAKGNVVTAHRTDERDGYTALQLAFDEQKPSRLSKPKLGQFKKAEVAPRRKVKEFRVGTDLLGKHAVGSEIGVDIFADGQMVDVTGTSKGKGYQGVMKRHGMRGEKRTHGQHEVFRHGGSIGCRLTPGRVIPGKRMPGHMGCETVTVQNMQVAKVLADKGIILVRGPVPGGKNGYVTLRHAVKPAIRQQHAG
ncbi:MAG: 50S ribosomal protein L3 [Myxococcales bacterium]|nr:50S ribosomal protein L3 [Myxococcales bacterium]